MKKPVYIYALVDPRTHLEFYVGYSNKPKKRLVEHIWEAKMESSRDDREFVLNNRKCKLIREILRAGEVPLIQIVAEVSYDSRWYWEKFFYAVYCDRDIVNTTSLRK